MRSRRMLGWGAIGLVDYALAQPQQDPQTLAHVSALHAERDLESLASGFIEDQPLTSEVFSAQRAPQGRRLASFFRLGP